MGAAGCEERGTGDSLVYHQIYHPFLWGYLREVTTLKQCLNKIYMALKTLYRG